MNPLLILVALVFTIAFYMGLACICRAAYCRFFRVNEHLEEAGNALKNQKELNAKL